MRGSCRRFPVTKALWGWIPSKRITTFHCRSHAGFWISDKLPWEAFLSVLHCNALVGQYARQGTLFSVALPDHDKGSQKYLRRCVRSQKPAPCFQARSPKLLLVRGLPSSCGIWMIQSINQTWYLNSWSKLLLLCYVTRFSAKHWSL